MEVLYKRDGANEANAAEFGSIPQTLPSLNTLPISSGSPALYSARLALALFIVAVAVVVAV